MSGTIVRSWKWPVRLLIGGLLIALVIWADQAVKEYMLYELGLIRGRAVEVTSFLNYVMVWNHGVSFGLFASGSEKAKLVLIGLSSTIAFVLFCAMLRARSNLMVLALGLVIGGAIGNVIDRVRYGAVADFWDVYIGHYHWPAFNLADACICVGVAAMLFDSIILEKYRRRVVA